MVALEPLPPTRPRLGYISLFKHCAVWLRDEANAGRTTRVKYGVPVKAELFNDQHHLYK